MLRVSLEHNLERVLEHSRSGITMVSRQIGTSGLPLVSRCPPSQFSLLQESLKKLGELPKGSAVVAGSTMVRAIVQIEATPTSPSQINAASKLTLLLCACVQVQACLGVLWGEGGEKSYGDGKSDVDIFCSAKAAPAVRSVSGDV